MTLYYTSETQTKQTAYGRLPKRGEVKHRGWQTSDFDSLWLGTHFEVKICRDEISHFLIRGEHENSTL